MSLRLSRFLAPLTTAIALGSFAPTASAAEPTLLDSLRAVSDSIDEVTRSAVEVVEAQRAYDDQMAQMQAAAREIAALFAPHTLIDELLDFGDAPVFHIADLLMPDDLPPLATLRASDPNGTSIYDSLVFHTR